MELIIKPTVKCDFACTFCSSPNLSKDKTDTLSLSSIKDFLLKHPDTNTIIVNGGDPLMLSPTYYFDIIELLEELGMETSLSFTTNLNNFFLFPDKWVELFKHPRVGVTTSFNYGDGRRKSKNEVYTVDDFKASSDLFLDRIGYRPDFISVITKDNIDTALDNVYLAKELDVECKLNYVLCSGKSKDTIPLYKIYSIYLDIIKLGLEKYEYNSKQLLQIMDEDHTTCPLNRNCDEHIRTLHPDGKEYWCGAFADDGLYEINETRDSEVGLDFMDRFIKSDCLTCEMFEICNGCYKKISDIRLGDIEEHCVGMLSIKEEILNLRED